MSIVAETSWQRMSFMMSPQHTCRSAPDAVGMTGIVNELTDV